MADKPVVGSIIEADGKQMEIVEVTTLLTPSNGKKNQFITLEGYLLSLREVKECRLCHKPATITAGYCYAHGVSLLKPANGFKTCSFDGDEKRSTFSRCSPGIGNRKTDL